LNNGRHDRPAVQTPIAAPKITGGGLKVP